MACTGPGYVPLSQMTTMMTSICAEEPYFRLWVQGYGFYGSCPLEFAGFFGDGEVLERSGGLTRSKCLSGAKSTVWYRAWAEGLEFRNQDTGNDCSCWPAWMPSQREGFKGGEGKLL